MLVIFDYLNNKNLNVKLTKEFLQNPLKVYLLNTPENPSKSPKE